VELALGADIVDGDDVGVRELGGGAGLALEALEELRSGLLAREEGLDGHVAAEVGW
jgi:hypothetical protein